MNFAFTADFWDALGVSVPVGRDVSDQRLDIKAKAMAAGSNMKFKRSRKGHVTPAATERGGGRIKPAVGRAGGE